MAMMNSIDGKKDFDDGSENNKNTNDDDDDNDDDNQHSTAAVHNPLITSSSSPSSLSPSIINQSKSIWNHYIWKRHNAQDNNHHHNHHQNYQHYYDHRSRWIPPRVLLITNNFCTKRFYAKILACILAALIGFFLLYLPMNDLLMHYYYHHHNNHRYYRYRYPADDRHDRSLSSSSSLASASGSSLLYNIASPPSFNHTRCPMFGVNSFSIYFYDLQPQPPNYDIIDNDGGDNDNGGDSDSNSAQYRNLLKSLFRIRNTHNCYSFTTVASNACLLAHFWNGISDDGSGDSGGDNDANHHHNQTSIQIVRVQPWWWRSFLPYWFDGENHLIVNININTILDLNLHNAMIAQCRFDASSSSSQQSVMNYRFNWDILLPCWHVRIDDDNDDENDDATLELDLVKKVTTSANIETWQPPPNMLVKRKFLCLYHENFHNNYDDNTADASLMIKQQQQKWIKQTFNRLRMQSKNLNLNLNFNFNCNNNKYRNGSENGRGRCVNDTIQLLRDSTFMLVIPATAATMTTTTMKPILDVKYFHQIMLAISQGTIPILFYPHTSLYQLPLDDAIDWQRILLQLPLARLPKLNTLLRTISSQTIAQMKQNGVKIYVKYFLNYDTEMATIFNYIRTHRIRLPLASPSVWWNRLDNVNVDHHNAELYDDDVDRSKPFKYLYKSTDVERFELESNYDDANRKGWKMNVDYYNIIWSRLPTTTTTTVSSLTLIDSQSTQLDDNDDGGDVLGGGGESFNSKTSAAARQIAKQSSPWNSMIDRYSAWNDISFTITTSSPSLDKEKFTIIILTYERENLLLQILNQLKNLPSLHKVIVVWNTQNSSSSPLASALEKNNNTWPSIGVPLVVLRAYKNSLNNRFIPTREIETDAIFSMDDDVINFSPDEILFAFKIWQQSRDQIVGFPARTHVYNRASKQWQYDATYQCQYSMVLTGASFFHRHYLHLYTNVMPSCIREKVDQLMNCEDIAMNFLIAQYNGGKPPIKVGDRWSVYQCLDCKKRLSNDYQHYSERNFCVNYLVSIYGYMPLRYTMFRAHSVLYNMTDDAQQCFDNL